MYGELQGTNYGAGVYGTARHNENGSYVDGRYAGYFNGATKVNGDLTVTGSISGVILSGVSNTSVARLSEEYAATSFADKLSTLSTTCFYNEAQVVQADMMEATSDSVSTVMSLDSRQASMADRMHYGLNVEQLREAFPDLVYERDSR